MECVQVIQCLGKHILAVPMNKKLNFIFYINNLKKMECSSDWKNYFYSREEKITIFNSISKQKKIRFLMMSILNCENNKDIDILMKQIIKLLS